MSELKITDPYTREMVMRELAKVADLRLEPAATVAEKAGIPLDQLDHLIHNRMDEVGIDTVVKILTKSEKHHTVVMDADGFLKDMDAALEASYQEFDEARRRTFEIKAYKAVIRSLISRYVLLRLSSGGGGFCG